MYALYKLMSQQNSAALVNDKMLFWRAKWKKKYYDTLILCIQFLAAIISFLLLITKSNIREQ
jgi:hypothetical protein